jgi:hypothetical protein
MEEDEIPDEHSEELADALMNFMSLFSQYVKEHDEKLWKRAIDYAKDYAETDNVKFLYYDDKDETKE